MGKIAKVTSLHNLGVQLQMQEVQIVATIADTGEKFSITILVDVTD